MVLRQLYQTCGGSMENNIAIMVDDLGPGVAALVCGVLMLWPVITQAVWEQWTGVWLSLAATGLLVYIGIATTATQFDQDMFPLAEDRPVLPAQPVQQAAWVVGSVLVGIFVVMLYYSRGSCQAELFLASALAVFACVANLRMLLDEANSLYWLRTQRCCEAVALILLVFVGPARVFMRND